MSIGLYDVTVPVLLRGLGRLSACLEKGRSHAEAAGIPAEELIGARLAPDMLTLAGQIQRASDTARFAVVRIGGVENVSMPDEERSFAELQDRIARTQGFLAAVPREAIDERTGATITVTIGRTPDATGRRPTTVRAVDYALQFALPNFFFHVTTAYDLLRMKGVPLGKPDYIGPLGEGV
ncbi:MAG TPA: DUF1993 domain-containing protein [Amaricoccus sp.]|nr:DUF1993 domain-containing protein [Amaricoccus sp.]